MIFLSLWLLTTVEAASAHAVPELPPVGAACVTCTAQRSGTLSGMSDAEWGDLRAGKIWRAPGARVEALAGLQSSNHAAAFFPHPPGAIWAVLTDFESWPGFMPHIRQTRVEQSEGLRQWVYQKYAVLFTALQHTTIYEADPSARRLGWKLDLERAHDIAASQGYWELEALDGGESTLVHYVSAVDTGRSVPPFVEEMLLTRSLEQLFQSLRAEVGRRGTSSYD